MTANLEWDCIPLTLSTLQGDLVFNMEGQLGTGAITGGYYLLLRDGCSMGAPLRVTLDDMPQNDGSVMHAVLTSGYKVNLTVELYESKDSPAQGEVLVEMTDLLMRHLNRTREDGGGRLTWNPSGDTHIERMVDDLFWVEDLQWNADGLTWAGSFGLASPFPYAQDAAEQTTSIIDGNNATLTNLGSSKFMPVIKAYGPITAFTITNETSGKVMEYDSSQPGASTVGGGNYIEFDNFRNTAYLNGNGPSRKAGIVVTDTEFFALEIGENVISVSGCDVDILWQSAWA